MPETNPLFSRIDHPRHLPNVVAIPTMGANQADILFHGDPLPKGAEISNRIGLAPRVVREETRTGFECPTSRLAPRVDIA